MSHNKCKMVYEYRGVNFSGNREIRILKSLIHLITAQTGYFVIMNFLRTILRPSQFQGGSSLIHTSAALNKNWYQNSDDGAAKWLRHNTTMFPPEEGVTRPAVSRLTNIAFYLLK